MLTDQLNELLPFVAHLGPLAVRVGKGIITFCTGGKVSTMRLDWLDWQLSADARIDVVGCSQTMLRSQNDEYVGVRQAAMLEFDHMQVRDGATKDAHLFQIIHQLIALDAKDTGDDVRPIFGGVTWR